MGAARKLRYVGIIKNPFSMTMEAIAYNLIRMPNLTASAA